MKKMTMVIATTIMMSLWSVVQLANALSSEQLQNAVYQGIYDEPVQLNEGKYEGEPFVEGGASRPTVTLAENLMASGDLNGDSIDDAAVILVEDSGGSGTFSYLAAVLDQDGQPVNQATLLLGDRVNLKAIAIKDGQIVVESIEQNEKVQKAYQVEGDQLVEKGAANLGAVSVSDLEGPTWMLTRWMPEQELAPNTEITAIFTDGNISGSSGCNTYSAPVTDQGGGELRIGSVKGTRMACPGPIGKQEHVFLTALSTVTRFIFFSGQLVLVHDNGAFAFRPTD